MSQPAQRIDPRWEFDITEYAGKRLAVTFQLLDEDEEVIDLTGYTADAKVVDENNTTILDLAPTVTAATGQFVMDLDIPDGTVPGRYDWVGALIEASGDEHVRFRGKFNIKTY